VIGDPISHSRSPLVHGFWLREHGLAGTYERERVAPERLPDFVNRLRGGEHVGCNVTLPHKEAVLRLVDEATPLALALGAANTLWRDRSGRLVADNTDAHGFLASLDEEAPGWRAARSALVIGAGGAARAVVAGLASAGLERIVIANRSREKAAAIATAHPGRAEAVGLDTLPALLANADLLVNTTPLGMSGKPALDIDLAALERGAVVVDIVYVPLETPLLARAKALGHRAVGGLGMLLHQAVPGFERWFGVRPKVTPELRRLVEADIRTGTGSAA
jgi:shikimate dehydrogenase